MLTHQEFENWLTLVKDQLQLGEARSRELCEELQDHFELAVAELVESGVDEPSAVVLAIEEFGDADVVATNLRNVLNQNRKRWMMNTGKMTFAAVGVVCLVAMFLWPNPPGNGIRNAFSSDSSSAELALRDQSVTSKANANIRKLLQKKVDFQFHQADIGRVIDFLSEELQCNVLVDRALEGDFDKETLFSSNLNQMQLSNAIRLSLDPYNATYIVQHGVLKIISLDDECSPYFQSRHLIDVGNVLGLISENEKSRIGQPFSRTEFGIGLSGKSVRGGGGGVFNIAAQPPLAQRLAPANKKTGKPDNEEPTEILTAELLLTHTITNIIEPDSWLRTGSGEGEIACLGGILILNTSESVASDVKDFLLDLEHALAN